MPGGLNLSLNVVDKLVRHRSFWFAANQNEGGGVPWSVFFEDSGGHPRRARLGSTEHSACVLEVMPLVEKSFPDLFIESSASGQKHAARWFLMWQKGGG